jgi:hypothetical protein
MLMRGSMWSLRGDADGCEHGTELVRSSRDFPRPLSSHLKGKRYSRDYVFESLSKFTVEDF